MPRLSLLEDQHFNFASHIGRGLRVDPRPRLHHMTAQTLEFALDKAGGVALFIIVDIRSTVLQRSTGKHFVSTFVNTYT